MKLPYKSENGKLVLDQAVWKLWDDGFGGIPEKLAAYGSKPTQLKAIAIDYGIYDEYEWIPEGCKTFVSLATKAGLKLTATSFEGDHQGQPGLPYGRLHDPLLHEEPGSLAGALWGRSVTMARFRVPPRHGFARP